MKTATILVIILMAFAGCTSETIEDPVEQEPTPIPEPTPVNTTIVDPPIKAGPLPYIPELNDCDYITHRTYHAPGTFSDLEVPNGTRTADPMQSPPNDALVLFVWDCASIVANNETIYEDVRIALSTVQVYVDDPTIQGPQFTAYFVVLSASTNNQNFSTDMSQVYPIEYHDIELTVGADRSAEGVVGSTFGDIPFTIMDADGDDVRPDQNAYLRFYQTVNSTWQYLDLDTTRDAQQNPAASYGSYPASHPGSTGTGFAAIAGTGEAAVGHAVVVWP